MSVDGGVTVPKSSAVVSLRDVNVHNAEAIASDDGSSVSGSEHEEDYEEVSTHKVSQISTGVLHLGGTPSNINMENSSDVHIGSRLNYNAPVTINQCVHVHRNSDVIRDGVMLREAIRGPVHVLESNQNNLSQATLISLNQNVQGTSNGYNVCSQSSAAATTYNMLSALCRHRRIYLAVIVILLLMMIVVVIVYFSYDSGSSARNDVPLHPHPKDPEPNPNTTLPGGHLIYSKEDWYGHPPKYKQPLRHPTPFIVISHTASPPCFSPVECATKMRTFQDYHVGGALNLPDIGYNFVVGGDGNVYEGRGWDVTSMHTGFVKRCNIAISLIGKFIDDAPTSGQLEAVEELIRLGLRLGKVAEDYKLVAMNETANTLSPGVVVYNIISEWPHFWRPTGDDIGKCPYIV